MTWRVNLRVESLDGRITPSSGMGSSGGLDVYQTGAALLGGSIDAGDQFNTFAGDAELPGGKAGVGPGATLFGGSVGQDDQFLTGGSLGGDDQFLMGGSLGGGDQFEV